MASLMLNLWFSGVVVDTFSVPSTIWAPPPLRGLGRTGQTVSIYLADRLGHAATRASLSWLKSDTASRLSAFEGSFRRFWASEHRACFKGAVPRSLSCRGQLTPPARRRGEVTCAKCFLVVLPPLSTSGPLSGRQSLGGSSSSRRSWCRCRRGHRWRRVQSQCSSRAGTHRPLVVSL